MKKIYAYRLVRTEIREHGHSVNNENISAFQDAIDSDCDNTVKLTTGNWFHRDSASGRIYLHSNGSFGYSGRGTEVIAEIV